MLFSLLMQCYQGRGCELLSLAQSTYHLKLCFVETAPLCVKDKTKSMVICDVSYYFKENSGPEWVLVIMVWRKRDYFIIFRFRCIIQNNYLTRSWLLKLSIGRIGLWSETLIYKKAINFTMTSSATTGWNERRS
jgi:hypothetical protein